MENNVYHIESILEHYSYESHCTLDVDTIGHILHHACTCPFHYENDACGHTLALARYLQEHDFPVPYHMDMAYQRELEIRRRTEELEKRRRMHKLAENGMWLKRTVLSPHTITYGKRKNASVYRMGRFSNYSRDIVFSLKIGQTRSHIIKSIPQFLEHVANHHEVSYGKAVAFRHHLEAFDNSARLLLAFLERHQEIPFYYNSTGRYFPLVSDMVDDLYDTLYAMDRTYHGLSFKEQKLKLHLKIRILEDNVNSIALIEKSLRELSSMLGGDKAILYVTASLSRLLSLSFG